MQEGGMFVYNLVAMEKSGIFFMRVTGSDKMHGKIGV